MNMLSVRNLCKRYPDFSLKDVGFDVEEGFITGFIGKNGSGKTTTLKSMLNLVIPDSGRVTVFGRDINEAEAEIKQELAFMSGEFEYYPQTKVFVLAKIFKKFYKNWDDKVFSDYLERFGINPKKRVKELSAGTKVKLGLALALSHGAKLLILDEPTSGLDPIARSEVSDIFQEIVEDGRHSVLFSTHITSDLDRCADYIVFIDGGKIILNETKDDILAGHLVVKGATDMLNEDMKTKLIGCKENRHGFSALMKKADYSPDSGLLAQAPNLEDIMIYYTGSKGEKA